MSKNNNRTGCQIKSSSQISGNGIVYLLFGKSACPCRAGMNSFLCLEMAGESHQQYTGKDQQDPADGDQTQFFAVNKVYGCLHQQKCSARTDCHHAGGGQRFIHADHENNAGHTHDIAQNETAPLLRDAAMQRRRSGGSPFEKQIGGNLKGQKHYNMKIYHNKFTTRYV